MLFYASVFLGVGLLGGGPELRRGDLCCGSDFRDLVPDGDRAGRDPCGHRILDSGCVT
jgi:hypothetical protein